MPLFTDAHSKPSIDRWHCWNAVDVGAGVFTVLVAAECVAGDAPPDSRPEALLPFLWLAAAPGRRFPDPSAN